MKILMTAITAATVVGLTVPATQAGASTRPAPTTEEADKGQPFKGKVEAVDTKARTLTVDGTVLQVPETSVLTKDGKPITLADIKVSDKVHGRSHTLLNGKTEALSVTVGEPKADD